MDKTRLPTDTLTVVKSYGPFSPKGRGIKNKSISLNKSGSPEIAGIGALKGIQVAVRGMRRIDLCNENI